MLSTIVIVAILAILYGLAWHNQPAKGGDNNPRHNTKT